VLRKLLGGLEAREGRATTGRASEWRMMNLDDNFKKGSWLIQSENRRTTPPTFWVGCPFDCRRCAMFKVISTTARASIFRELLVP
jgi:hypothetical protein